MFDKIICYTLGILDVILLILIAGFIEERPVISFILLIPFATFSYILSRYYIGD